MIDIQKNIIQNNSSDYIEVDTQTSSTSLHYPSLRNKNNILHIAGVTMLLGSQFAYSNPLINFNNQTTNIENIINDYKNNVELPSTYYITEINSILSSNYTKKEIIKEILSFKSLVYNWDGFGSIPLEVEASSNAIYLVNEFDNNLVSSLSEITPQTNGTISFVWENMDNEILSLEIGNETMSYYFSLLNSKTIYSNNIEINEKELKNIMGLVNRL